MTDIARAVPAPARRGAAPPVSQMSAWLVPTGLASLGVGASALVVAVAVPAEAIAYYGGLLAAAGAVQLLELVHARSRTERAARAMVALLYLAFGGALVWNPAAATAVERLIVVLFAASGLFRMIASAAWPGLFRAWGLMAGALAIAVGVLLVVLWPPSAVRLLAAAVALDLAAYGAAAVLLGFSARSGAASGSPASSSPST